MFKRIDKPFDLFFMFYFFVFRGAVNMLILDLGNLKVNSEKNKVGGDDKVIDVLLTVAQVCLFWSEIFQTLTK